MTSSPLDTDQTSPIRAGVLGYGLSGRVFHAPFLAANPDYSLDVIVTGNAERAAAAQAAYPNVQVLGTAEELFARDELDLVVIGTPPETHVPLAHAALDAGLAVVIDKPFSTTSQEGWELVNRAASLGLPITVFQNRRWDGDFLTLQALLAEGALGEVHRFESRFESFKPGPARSWKAQATPAAGGGILFDLGAHLIDQAVQLFGPVADLDGAVSADVRTRRSDAAADDDSFVSLQHASGVSSQLWMSKFAAQVGPRYRVLGSTSAYVKWGLDGQEDAIQAGARPEDADFGVEPESSWGRLGVDGATVAVPTRRGSYSAFYAVLADALLRGGELPVDPADAIRTIELIERIHASTR
ncbi:Gfo/Idh/MocA family oxidoreductase [Cryobacterium sp. 1639]|uniref:Gfo/Idh/MocA family protein n=1 Tax=Cryobacterium inferilacus TaxID=2866629 RepID=UPI001C73A502|nr:Gfo/Idh/MocA family oxidoreductase [Cryobacterium sp. 1639]MBX0299685.1 Gfo/Idh/MocA family oxidoreductase [Cryobacterium sp. 1639]